MRPGDLLFVAEGESAFSEAIYAATAAGDSVRFVHVAIMGFGGEVIEASPEEGVRVTTLEAFLGSSPGVRAKRLTEPFPAAQAVERAKGYVGQPYDWWYLPDNGKMYCSELVYESCLREDGSHIFEARPMNFRAPDGTMPAFWEELYGRLGMDVPEGMPGTNPADMARDPRLEDVDIQ